MIKGVKKEGGKKEKKKSAHICQALAVAGADTNVFFFRGGRCVAGVARDAVHVTMDYAEVHGELLATEGVYCGFRMAGTLVKTDIRDKGLFRTTVVGEQNNRPKDKVRDML